MYPDWLIVPLKEHKQFDFCKNMILQSEKN